MYPRVTYETLDTRTAPNVVAMLAVKALSVTVLFAWATATRATAQPATVSLSAFKR